MADYVRQHDFSVKDALTTGDPNKVIKGSEVDEELDAILTAVGTKVDKTAGHTTNNLASLNSIGNIEDSGVLKTNVVIKTDTDVSGNSWVVDEDNMASDLDTKVPTQQSVKAYIATQLAGATVTLMNPHAVSTVGSAVAHGLGVEPASMLVYIECLTTDAGYSAGDKVWVETPNSTLSVNFDATNIQAIQSGNNLQIAHKTTTTATSITSANWKLMAKVIG